MPITKVGPTPSPFDQHIAFGNPMPGWSAEPVPAPEVGGLDAITAAGAPLAAKTVAMALGSFATGTDSTPVPSPRHALRR